MVFARLTFSKYQGFWIINDFKWLMIMIWLSQVNTYSNSFGMENSRILNIY